MLLMSLILTVQDIPQRAVGPMSTFAITVGAFAAGFCCTKIQRRQGLAYGAVCGAVLCVISMLASLGYPGGGFGVLSLIKAMFMLLGGMLGGVLGVNTRQKRRK
jgi:putative membrane protein (TIGR04086 family)